MTDLRRDCRWFLRYAGRPWCRAAAFGNPQSPMRRLDLGCDCDADYLPVEGKGRGRGGGDPPKLEEIEWEDEA